MVKPGLDVYKVRARRHVAALACGAEDGGGRRVDGWWVGGGGGGGHTEQLLMYCPTLASVDL